MPARRATKPRLRLVPSAPAKPKLVFAPEPFYLFARETRPLFTKHWKELGRHRAQVPLDADYQAYAMLERAGKLHCLTVRLPGTFDKPGELVGYVFNIVGPHTHYKTTLHALVDMYWLDPRYRGGVNGLKLLRANEEMLRDLGVVRVLIAENLQFKNRRKRMARVLFKRMGYKAMDIQYGKLLQE